MKQIIKKILKEQVSDKVITKVLLQLNQGKIKPPYFKNLDLIGLTEEEIKTVLQMFTNGNVNMGDRTVRNSGGYILYHETSDGYWVEGEYDERGNETYFEDSDGYWRKKGYDKNNVLIYHENSIYGIILDKR